MHLPLSKAPKASGIFSYLLVSSRAQEEAFSVTEWIIGLPAFPFCVSPSHPSGYLLYLCPPLLLPIKFFLCSSVTYRLRTAWNSWQTTTTMTIWRPPLIRPITSLLLIRCSCCPYHVLSCGSALLWPCMVIKVTLFSSSTFGTGREAAPARSQERRRGPLISLVYLCLWNSYYY